jgi:hypothetical protein
MSAFFGSPAQIKQVSGLSPGQTGLHQQLLDALSGRGGGAFGGMADYYRDLLGGNQTYDAMAAPEMRQFREETVPGLAEQFAGLGAGGSFGSSFKSAQAQAGASLAERLAALRAQLRQQGAQGMMGMGQQSLSPFMQNVMIPRSPGLLEGLLGLGGQAAGAFGGQALGGLGQGLASFLNQKLMPQQQAG